MYPYNQQQGYHDNAGGDSNYNMYRHNQATSHPSAQQFGMHMINQGYDPMMQNQNTTYGNAPNQSTPNLAYQQQLYYQQQQQQIPGVTGMPQSMYGPFMNTQQVRITPEQQAMQKQIIEQQLKQQKLLIEQEKELKRKQNFQEQKERLKAISTKKHEGITNNYQKSPVSGSDQGILTQSQLSFNTMWERTTDSIIGRSHKNPQQEDSSYSVNTNSNTNTTHTNLPNPLSTPAVQPAVQMNSTTNILHDSTIATDDFSDFQQASDSYYKSESNSQSNRMLNDTINSADISIRSQTAPSSQCLTTTVPNSIQEEDDFGDFMTGMPENNALQSYGLSQQHTTTQTGSLAEYKYTEESLPSITQPKFEINPLKKLDRPPLLEFPEKEQTFDNNKQLPEGIASNTTEDQQNCASGNNSTIRKEALIGINDSVTRASDKLESCAKANVSYPSWCLQDSEIPSLYKTVYEAVSAPNGDITTAKVKSILLSSGVNKKTLYKIWEISNRERPGTLNMQELYLALGLVALAQTGCKIDQLMSSLMSCAAAPIPKIKLANEISNTYASSQHIKTQVLPSPENNSHRFKLNAQHEPPALSKNVEPENWQTFSAPKSNCQSQSNYSDANINDKYSIFREINAENDKSQLSPESYTGNEDDNFGSFKKFDEELPAANTNQLNYSCSTTDTRSDNSDHQEIFKSIAVTNQQPTSGAADTKLATDIFNVELQTANNKPADSQTIETVFNSNESIGEFTTSSYDRYAILRQVDGQLSFEDYPKKPDNASFANDDDFGEFSSAITTVPSAANPHPNVMTADALNFYLPETNSDSRPNLLSNSLNQSQPLTEYNKQSQKCSDFSAFAADHSKDTVIKENPTTSDVKSLNPDSFSDYMFANNNIEKPNPKDASSSLNTINSQTGDYDKFQGSNIFVDTSKPNETTNTNYRTDRYRNLSSDIEQPVDTIYNKWQNCLEKALQDLQSGIDILLSSKNHKILQEICSNSKGSSFIKALSEIFKVVCRIDAAASRSEIDSVNLKSIVSNIKLKWAQFIQEASTYCNEVSGDYNCRSQCLTAGELATNCNHIACGICLLNVNKADLSSENVINYGGRRYHSGCANFWCNRVSCILPALQALELR